jgi:hypothetical protein
LDFANFIFLYFWKRLNGNKTLKNSVFTIFNITVFLILEKINGKLDQQDKKQIKSTYIY